MERFYLKYSILKFNMALGHSFFLTWQHINKYSDYSNTFKNNLLVGNKVF